LFCFFNRAIFLKMNEADIKIASLDRKIEHLRHEWLKAETDVDRNLIERRAKLLILAKQAIEKHKQQASKPDTYEVAKNIFSS